MASLTYNENKVAFLLNKYFMRFSIIALPITGIIVLALGITENTDNIILVLFVSLILMFSGVGIMLLCKEDIFSNHFQVAKEYFTVPYSTWDDIKENKSPIVRYEDIKDIMLLSYEDIKNHFPKDRNETVYPLDSPWILGIRIILKDGRKYDIWKRRVELEGLSALVRVLKKKRSDILLLEHLEIPNYLTE